MRQTLAPPPQQPKKLVRMNSQGALRSASVAASWLMNLRLRLNASGPGTRIQVRQEQEVGKNMQGGGSEQALGQAGSAPKAQVHPTCSPQAPKEPRRMAREGPRRQLDSGNDWPVVTRKQVDDLQ